MKNLPCDNPLPNEKATLRQPNREETSRRRSRVTQSISQIRRRPDLTTESKEVAKNKMAVKQIPPMDFAGNTSKIRAREKRADGA